MHLQSDSGGPLTYKAGNQHILIGAVSFGDECRTHAQHRVGHNLGSKVYIFVWEADLEIVMLLVSQLVSSS